MDNSYVNRGNAYAILYIVMNTSKKQVIEGEVISDTTQSNEPIVKSSKSTRPTYRQIQFAKNYKEGNTLGNAKRSAIKAGYSESSSESIGSQLLKNPKVLAILNAHVEVAEGVITDLMHDESPAIRLAAAKETLDRTQGKAIARSESVHVNLTVEDMLGSS